MKALTILFPVFFMILLGFTAKVRGWITRSQKAGANAIVFQILFPIMVFNMMLTVSVETSSLFVILYVFAAFVLAMAVGKLVSGFVGKKYSHFSYLLMSTVEGGNVALPLYLSIVGSSSNTVIFDIAGSALCFIVLPVWIARLVLNLSGGYRLLAASPFFELYTGVVNQATAPIVGMILFILGYDLRIDKETIGPILRLAVARVLFYGAVIGGFFLLFPVLMQDKSFLMAVLIYFMSPTGFGMLPVIAPVLKNREDASFASAYISVYMLITLAVYALVVVFIV